MSAATFLRPEKWFTKNGGPRYFQLAQRLRDGIESGVIHPSSPLPSEREMAKITELSRVTIRKAILQLASDNLVRRIQGAGTFVRMSGIQLGVAPFFDPSFGDAMERCSTHTTSRWLERGIFLPSKSESDALGLPKGAEVSRIYRLRLPSGRPVALERSSLPIDILPNPLEIKDALSEILNGHYRQFTRAVRKLSAVNLAIREAELLEIPEGTAALLIESTSYLPCGRPAKLTQSLCVGGVYDFTTGLRP